MGLVSLVNYKVSLVLGTAALRVFLFEKAQKTRLSFCGRTEANVKGVGRATTGGSAS